MVVRTRFAPSPTGFLHVGSVRTALFSWLYAKHHDGQFILRIEDTDSERSTQESVDAILDGMKWLGLDWDEGPIYQTQRYPRYHAVAQQLLSQKKAYRCVCSKQRLDDLRQAQLANKEKPRYDGHCRDRDLAEGVSPYVIRFKMPQEGFISFHDEVFGAIETNNGELDDLVLIRSDGHPTYNFAVVIDDSDMQITHVIRGDDHINNTPKQIHLLQALNMPIPNFAHLPMILGEDGKRLSKRHGAVNVLQFKEEGYLPQALLNYLVRLGWSCGDEEIFSRRAMIAKFNLTHVSRSSAAFNYEKLKWLNQHYLKESPAKEIVPLLKEQFEKEGMDLAGGPELIDVIPVFAERSKTLLELAQMSRFLYEDTISYDEEAVKKQLQGNALELLEKLALKLSELTAWKAVAIHDCIHAFCAALSIGMGKVAQPLRVAVTGSSSSPSIDITLELLGRQRTLARIEKVLAMQKT